LIRQQLETLWAQAEIDQETAAVLYNKDDDEEQHGRPEPRLPAEIREAVMLLTGDKNGDRLPEYLGCHRNMCIWMAEYLATQKIRPLPEAK